MEDVRVKHVGFIALGLADAIVEITGVHAGFLGRGRLVLIGMVLWLFRHSLCLVFSSGTYSGPPRVRKPS
ncbi:MAG: hypothetical protein ABWW69_01830 [Pyrodictiaceae archaeon]